MDTSFQQGLQGHTVIDGNGRIAGVVEGLILDTSSWRVRALRVKLEKEVADTIGEPHGAFRAAVLQVPVEAVAGVGDTIVLDCGVESFATNAKESPASRR